MPINNVVITGSNGTVGYVLKEGLSSYSLTLIDQPEYDVANYQHVLDTFQNQDAVFHLAWDTATENFDTEEINPFNLIMIQNVYKAALQQGVRRVVMASSVHADSYLDRDPSLPLLSPDSTPVPDSLYGASKVYMEALGRYYATQGLEVVCVRFGGVPWNNKPNAEDAWDQRVWLSRSDCVSLCQTLLSADNVPNNFQLLYAVSNNDGRVHDTSNVFGWEPKNGWNTSL